MKTVWSVVTLLVLALSSPAAPVSIFDGKTLEGWEGDAQWWRVEDGMITGGSRTEKIPHNYFIATTKPAQNFDLRLKLKLTGDPKTGLINSGVQIRSQRVPSNTEMSGYQVDAGDGWWGKLYDESRRNKVVGQAADLAAVNAAVKSGEWNEYRVRAEGPHIQSWINGVLALDYTEADPNIPQDGFIGIQIHAGGVALVQVKDVTIEELPPTPDAPTWAKVGMPGAKNAVPGVTAPQPGDKASYNGGPSGAKTPEEEMATFTLPPGFEAQLVASEDVPNGIGKFVPLAFDQKGALWTTTALEYPVDGNENPAAADALYASHAKDKVLIYDRDPKSPTGYASKPRIFADGLAIPLGVLPYKKGCYVLHGHDIVFMEDINGDGKADKTTVILTGFGVQDSHLFPHQFTRAPGGYIWMAQGAFNYGTVRRPIEPPEKAVQFDQTRMARFRPDGSGFDITSNGPCNIWGLVLTGEGESFIQEANDFGYPVMPFHEYGNYPGCSERQWKSYAPEFPGAAPDFRMGGTGLSGLALTDKTGPFPEAWREMMLVANPITNRVQAIKMHRDGPYWKLDKPLDFLVSTDPWFRPVAISIGPDGCLYVVDWYNKIISHNEVPRNHPDRDKTRGRIWRIVPTAAKPFSVPDFTKLSGKELLAKLGDASLAQSHLAWQTLVDRGPNEEDSLLNIAADGTQSTARRVQALWALTSRGDFLGSDIHHSLILDSDRNVRREAVHALLQSSKHATFVHWAVSQILDDPDPEVRAEIIRKLGWELEPLVKAKDNESLEEVLSDLLHFAKASLPGPLAPSTKSGKPIKVREAYDREFERYLVRMFLERQPEPVAKFLDSEVAAKLPIEGRLLASLALEPKVSAARVAKLLPKLDRAPGQEEVLRLAQFPEEPGVGDALKMILQNPVTRTAALESLLAVRTKLDASKLAPFLNDAANVLLASNDAGSIDLGAKLAAGYQLAGTEAALVNSLQAKGTTAPAAAAALRALAEIGGGKVDFIASFAENAADPTVRDEALSALAGSKAADAPARVLALFPKLTPSQQRAVLGKLSASKAGASAIVAAASSGSLPKSSLDGSVLDRLQVVLGDKNAALAKLLGEMSAFFRPVLALDGSEEAWSQSAVTLDGPCTIETWVKLDPKGRGISNADGIFGIPGQLDINFAAAKFRVYAGGKFGDVVVAKKPVIPDLWTHLAATRNAQGIWKLYFDGDLDATGTKPAPGKIENPRIGWTTAKGGTQGALSEFRVWNIERTAYEIRSASDRSLAPSTPGLVFSSAAGDWGKLQSGAKIVKASDYPPILTPDEAATLDAKYTKYRALAAKPGDKERGQLVSAVCQACHTFGTTGGNIGPILSGIGAMGTEGILRNIIQPNAAMENGYRIFRVEMKNGDLLDALYVSEDKDAIVVRMPGVEDRRIPRADIRSTKYLRRSLMPEGLLESMTDTQVTDLLTYLKSLKGS